MIITCPSCTAQYVVDPEQFGVVPRTVRCSNCDHLWQARLEELQPLPLPSPPDDAAPDEDAVPVAASPVAAASEAEEDAAREQPADWLEEDAGHPSADAEEPPPAAVVLRPIDRPSMPPPAEFASPEDGRLADKDADLDRSLDPAETPSEEDWPPAVDWPRHPLSAPAMGVDAVPEQTTPIIAERTQYRRLLMVAAGAGAALLLCLGVLFALKGPVTRAIPGMAALYHLVGAAPAPLGAGLDISDVSSSREWVNGDDMLIVTGIVTNTATEARPLPPLRVALFDVADSQVQEAIVEPEKTMLAPHENSRFTARIANPATSARRMVVSFDITAAGAS